MVEPATNLLDCGTGFMNNMSNTFFDCGARGQGKASQRPSAILLNAGSRKIHVPERGLCLRIPLAGFVMDKAY